MSGWIPQINDWDRQGLDWQYLDQSTMRIFEIPANTQLQLPLAGFTFNYPEGVLLHFSAGFDHPACGVRMESDPEFDTEEFFTINNIALGLSRPDILVYAIIPPITPAGFYSIRVGSPWVWKNWMRLYLFNTDSIPHRVLGHGYHMAVLKKPRKEKEKMIQNVIV